MRAATVCAEPGCGGIATRKGRCPAHQPVDRYQARRLSGWESGRLRMRLIAQRGERCQLCGNLGPVEMHHLDGDPGNNADSNLELRCPRHNPRGTPTHHR